MATNCVPPDGFWRANREIAERLWQRGDGATVSTRIAEDTNAATGIPVASAKVVFHGGLSLALANFISKATGSPALGALAGLGAFVYLEQDRC